MGNKVSSPTYRACRNVVVVSRIEKSAEKEFEHGKLKSRSCQIATAGIIVCVLGFLFLAAGAILLGLPAPEETIRCEGYTFPITCDLCKGSKLELICPVDSLWMRRNMTICSSSICTISDISSNDFGVYLCGENLEYGVHVLVRAASSGICSPPSWRIALGTLFIVFAVPLLIGGVIALEVAELLKKLCCGFFN